MSNNEITDYTVPRFIHSFRLGPSQKHIYSYIFDIIKHREIKEPVYIDPATLATVGCVDTTNRALAITRELESLGLISRTADRINGKRAIKYSMPPK